MHQEWHESTEFDESTFAQRVFEIVRQIPEGRVTTYGDIAIALGAPRGARQVGWAIAGAPPGLELPFHRVVNREGFLSGGWAFGHPEIMKQRLVAEGVPFRDEYTVDIARCRWTLGASSTPADEVHDFEQVALFDDDLRKGRTLDDLTVPFDDDEAFMQIAPSKKVRNRRSRG